MAADSAFGRWQSERERLNSEDGLTGLTQDLVSCAILEVYDGVAVSLKALHVSLEERMSQAGFSEACSPEDRRKGCSGNQMACSFGCPRSGRCLFSGLSDLPHDRSLFTAGEVFRRC